jgi:hypothetical protein
MSKMEEEGYDQKSINVATYFIDNEINDIKRVSLINKKKRYFQKLRQTILEENNIMT